MFFKYILKSALCLNKETLLKSTDISMLDKAVLSLQLFMWTIAGEQPNLSEKCSTSCGFKQVQMRVSHCYCCQTFHTII